MIVDSHVAGVSRSSRDPETRELIMNDKFMEILRKYYSLEQGDTPH